MIFHIIVILVISHFGFEGGTLVIIALDSGLCLPFTECTSFWSLLASVLGLCLPLFGKSLLFEFIIFVTNVVLILNKNIDIQREIRPEFFYFLFYRFFFATSSGRTTK